MTDLDQTRKDLDLLADALTLPSEKPEDAIRCPIDSMEANLDPPDRTPDLYRRIYERCPHCSGDESDCLGHGKWRR